MTIKTLRVGGRDVEVMHSGICISGHLYIGYTLKEALKEAKKPTKKKEKRRQL